jgi:L-idonate 5-dehydrogenase
VMLGLQRAGDIAVPMATAITRELTLVGSFRFNDELDDVLDALADGSLDAGPVISHELPIAEGLRALELARDASVSSKVLLSFSAADDDRGAEA